MDDQRQGRGSSHRRQHLPPLLTFLGCLQLPVIRRKICLELGYKIFCNTTKNSVFMVTPPVSENSLRWLISIHSSGNSGMEKSLNERIS